jgi:hypothetical protein
VPGIEAQFHYSLTNYAGPTLESIGERFGLQPFIDKRVAIIGEGQGTHRLVSRLLSITGEDAISVDRKGIGAWEGVLSTRVWVLSNGAIRSVSVGSSRDQEPLRQ